MAKRFVIAVMTLGALFAAEAGRTAMGQDKADPPLTVGRIDIVTNGIFSLEEIEQGKGVISTLRKAMNGVHVDTRQYVLRRELLFAEGDPFDPAALAETERNLRELGFLNNIHVTAIDTTAEGRVNVQVSTRDSWSLQANLAYARSSGGDTRWTAQLSDKNFLGHGVTLGAGVGGDENSNYWNAWFRKRRVTSVGLQVGFDYAQRGDGHFRNIFINRPFYAQNDPWGLEVGAWDGLNDVRYFLSNGGPAGIDPGSSESLYARIPSHDKGLEAVFLRRVSAETGVQIWRLGIGVKVTDFNLGIDQQSSWELSDDRWVNLGFLAEPGQPLAREQGTTVYPYLQVYTLGRRWAKARYIMQYGPVEDIALSWSAMLRTGPSGPGVGSTTGFGGQAWLTEMWFSRGYSLGPGMGSISGSAMWQAGSPENRYYLYNIVSGWVARLGQENQPWITRVFAEYAQSRKVLGSEALVLGLGRGLRTLDFDGMSGDQLVRWNIEQGKAMPWEVLGLFNMGLAAFYNGGCAWYDDEDRSLADARHEAGVGFRLGPTRSAAAQVSRLDISWALDGSRGPVFTATTRGFF